MVLEEDGHALQHVLDVAVLLLVGVQDLQEGAVRLRGGESDRQRNTWIDGMRNRLTCGGTDDNTDERAIRSRCTAEEQIEGGRWRVSRRVDRREGAKGCVARSKWRWPRMQPAGGPSKPPHRNGTQQATVSSHIAARHALLQHGPASHPKPAARRAA
jgi:hypothetical protein